MQNMDMGSGYGTRRGHSNQGSKSAQDTYNKYAYEQFMRNGGKKIASQQMRRRSKVGNVGNQQPTLLLSSEIQRQAKSITPKTTPRKKYKISANKKKR